MKKIIICLLLLLPVFCFGYDYQLKKISGDKQLVLRGNYTKDDFVILLIDKNNNPVPGVKINFIITKSNYFNDDEIALKNLNKQSVFTDKDGYAKAKICTDKQTDEKLIVMANADDVLADPTYFTVSVLNKNWLLLMIAAICGGGALLLFGMFKINSSFQKIASQNIRAILTKFTNTRTKGFFTGLLVTGINQSSTATLLLQITLTSAGLMTFFQAMAVTVGASVGSTVTGQLVAFKLVDYALMITAAGYFISFFSKKRKLKEFGEAIFGFGLLFFGMKLMSEAMLPITLNTELLASIAKINSPLFLIIF